MMLISSMRFLILTMMMTGCSTSYYGYKENEWNALSEKEKEAAAAEYQQIIDEKNEKEHEELIEAYKQKIIRRGIEYTPVY